MNLSKNKEKHTLISPENLTLGQVYTFNYNPVDQPHDPFHPDEWLREMHRTIKSLFGCRIICYPEYSKMGRWHVHGFFYPLNVNYFYLKDLPKLVPYGALEIDTITDFYTWNNYIRKNDELVRPLLESQPYKIHNYRDGEPDIITITRS